MFGGVMLATLVLLMSGCTRFDIEMKCQDGVLYSKSNGAWIQAKLYENNKCLPMESTP